MANNTVDIKIIPLKKITKKLKTLQEADELQLAEMKYKIKNNLVIDPITVTIDTTAKEEEYIIISGYLQFLAYSKVARNNAKYNNIRCLIMNSSSHDNQDIVDVATSNKIKVLSKEKRKEKVIQRIKEYKILKKEQRIPRININKVVADEFGLDIRTINLYIKENNENKIGNTYKVEHKEFFKSKDVGPPLCKNDIYDMIIENKKLRSNFIREIYFKEMIDPQTKLLFDYYPTLIAYYRNNVKTFPDKASKSFVIALFDNLGYKYEK